MHSGSWNSKIVLLVLDQQLQSVDKPAAKPQYTSFGVQAFPDVLDALTQAAMSLKSLITVGIIKIV